LCKAPKNHTSSGNLRVFFSLSYMSSLPPKPHFVMFFVAPCTLLPVDGDPAISVKPARMKASKKISLELALPA
jgi:hypothetical protein